MPQAFEPSLTRPEESSDRPTEFRRVQLVGAESHEEGHDREQVAKALGMDARGREHLVEEVP